MTAPRLLAGAAALGAAAILAASCTSGGNAPSTPAPASPPATSKQVKPECADLITAGQGLVNVVTQFVSGQATGDQVRAAAADLSTSIDTARQAAGAQSSAQLDAAKASLQQLSTALAAQPPDISAMRAAANQALTALRGAVAVCQTPTAG